MNWKWWRNKAIAGKTLTAITREGSGVALANVGNQDDDDPELLECYLQGQLSDQATTLKQLAARHNVKNRTATTVLPAGSYDTILMESPHVSRAEMNDAVRWQIADRIDFPVEQAIVQTLEIPGQAERGRMPMVYVVVADRNRVKEEIDFYDALQLDLQYIDIPELAQRNIAMYCPEDAIGVATLRLEQQHGVLTISHDGELYLARTLDMGYVGLIEQPALTNSDGGLQLADMTDSVTHAYNQIVLEIQRSLDYYESHFAKIPIGSLVLAPLPVEIPELEPKLSDYLGLQVRELDLNSIIHPHVPLDREIQSACFTAIGAGLRWNTNMQMIKRMST